MEKCSIKFAFSFLNLYIYKKNIIIIIIIITSP